MARTAFEGSGGSSSRRAPIALVALLTTIAILAFTAARASADTAQIGSVSNVSYSSADVSGTVSVTGFFATYSFEYSLSEVGPWTSASGGFLPKGADQAVSKRIEGLEGGTEYFVRLTTNSGAVSPGAPPYPSFTTLTADPPAIPGDVELSNVFSTSATASSKVVRPVNSDDLTCRFEYVDDAEFSANGFANAIIKPCTENPIGETDAGTEKAVTAALGCTAPLTDGPESCLKPETTYHLRLTADNAAPGVVTKDAASTFTTAAKVAAPSVLETDDATGVTSHEAAVKGEVQRPAGDDPALDALCRFEYVTDKQFDETGFDGALSAPCAENPITKASADGEGKQVVTAGLENLKAGTTFHLRLSVENAGGAEAKEAAATFTTIAAPVPAVSIDPVAGGTYTTAHVAGTFDVDDPGQSFAVAAFQVSADGGLTWSDFGNPDGTTYEPGLQFVEKTFTGLQPNTTYTFRLAATYAFDVPNADARGEMAYSSEETMTTEPLPPPTTEDLQVTDITGTSAHFSARINPNAPAGPLSELAKKAFATEWHFECTPECKNANGNVIGGTLQGEDGAQTVTGDVKRLDPNTEYEVRLFASNEGGGEPAVETFHTELIKPTVIAALGGSDGKGGYTLQGSVNPNGSPVSDCKFEWGPNSADYAFTADCSPPPGEKAQPVTVEAHLAGLSPGVVYHYNLLATNGAGTSESGDQEFTPTLAETESCPKEQIRKENNSLDLPECRAYEMVTPPGKEGFQALFVDFDGGNGVHYRSGAGNIAKSGQNIEIPNDYVTLRTAAGWETIPNLNGSSGSIWDEPSNVTGFFSAVRLYSEDLRSSVWQMSRSVGPPGYSFWLRNPDGTFTFMGPLDGAASSEKFISADLSHLVIGPSFVSPLGYGQGIYEFVGTGNSQPRRVDVDNTGSPITTCQVSLQSESDSSFARSISKDGRVVVVWVAGGCGGANPPSNELWARVNGTTSFDISASQCDRTVVDPGGVCNGPVGSGDCSTTANSQGLGIENGPGCRGATYQGASSDGSRVFFTTTRQLLDADTDESNDLYACDIPSVTPAPIDQANHCPALRQISAGAPTGADVEGVGAFSADGSTALFIAKGALADNKDALGENALDGDHNLYLWRSDLAHPNGRTAFVGRLDSDDLAAGSGQIPQTTPDGRYVIFTTTSRLLHTDTDSARDVYRYDADSGELSRVSTNVYGVAGNGDGFDASTAGATAHHLTTTVSDDGQKIVFISAEALSPVDGNEDFDVYLWTPEGVSLITPGAVEAGGRNAAISPSGQDIYFETSGALTPADGDDVFDVYDARIGGGFSFTPKPICRGEGCQGDPTPAAPEVRPASAQPKVIPPRKTTCRKGRVLKKGKCVKRNKKPSGKKHHGKTRSHKQGGGK